MRHCHKTTHRISVWYQQEMSCGGYLLSPTINVTGTWCHSSEGRHSRRRHLNSSHKHSVKVRRNVYTHLQFLAVTLMQTSQSSSSLLSTSLAEALISNVASLMSSPARLYRISLLITVLTLDTTLSWRKLFQSSILRSQLLFTSCNHKSVTGVVVL